MGNVEIAERLFAAIAAQDEKVIRSLCAPDMRLHQNGGPGRSLESLLKFIGLIGRVATDFRYEEAVRSATETGFVEEHRVRATLPDGSLLDFAVCVVAEVSGGKVTEVREYADSAGTKGLSAAISAA